MIAVGQADEAAAIRIVRRQPLRSLADLGQVPDKCGGRGRPRSRLADRVLTAKALSFPRLRYGERSKLLLPHRSDKQKVASAQNSPPQRCSAAGAGLFSTFQLPVP